MYRMSIQRRERKQKEKKRLKKYNTLSTLCQQNLTSYYISLKSLFMISNLKEISSVRELSTARAIVKFLTNFVTG